MYVIPMKYSELLENIKAMFPRYKEFIMLEPNSSLNG